MSWLTERSLQPETGHCAPESAADTNGPLKITVVFTSVPSTLVALREAASLAHSLGARITLVVPQVVPYPAPLDTPPVLLDFNETRFRVMAGMCPVAMNVNIHLCRDRFEELNSVLEPGSIIVLGGIHKWWLTSDERLARRLRRAGFEVIFSEMERA
jgi:hypothetical protein